MPISLKTELHKSAGRVPYTNVTGSTIKAGTPVLAGGRLAVALKDIANGESDEVLVTGRVRGVKANEAWAVGDLVGWDANGNPAVGDLASGCWTNVRTNWDLGYQGGIVEVAAAAGDELGIFDVSGQLRTARGQHTTVTASDTVVTGLTKVVSVVASLDSDPTDNPMLVSASIGDQAGAPASGSVLIKTWQNTGGTDPTPAAASTFAKKVNWIAIGY
jgi:predicted RecA/RadA family phage recombinase